MYSRRAAAVLLLFSLVVCVRTQAASAAAEGDGWSGSYRGRVLDGRFRHEQALARRGAALTEQRSRPPLADRGDIAVIDSSGGVVADPNLLDLRSLTLRFTPTPNGFSGTAGTLEFNDAARENGVPLELGDDDSARVLLPFSFPYFGEQYDEIFVQSDGNLTLREPDADSAARSLPRAIAGPPRIAPYFVDLDPSQVGAYIRVYSLSDRIIFTWDGVPQFTAAGQGRRQIFQVELTPDGAIAFHYLAVNLSTIVVAVVPGDSKGFPAAVDLSQGFGPVEDGFAELFQLTANLDEFAAGQSFYRNHDDSYDFMVVFNNFGLTPGSGAFAYELNVRNETLGIGDLLANDPVFDFGPEFGSPRRLSSFLNMGPLTAYPSDPSGYIPTIGENTTLSVLSHEVGHRWLAYVDFVNPATGVTSGDLLGRQGAHWSFFFNSKASFVEGNLIEDKGVGVSPRFETTGAVSTYSDLDQYLMGLIGPEDVSGFFLVDNPNGSGFNSPSRAPQTGVTFNGVRIPVEIDSIVAAEGPRKPDHTVSEKEFRLAFVLLVDSDAAGVPEADIAKLDQIRRAWEPYFEQVLMDRAQADTALLRMLQLSAWPATGVLRGGAGQATITIAEPLATDLDVALTTDSPAASVPSSVTLPAGKTSVSFAVSGDAPGVAVIRAEASQPGFEVSQARINVLEGPSALRIVTESGAGQSGSDAEPLARPIVVRVTDDNRVPYSGVPLEVTASGDGAAAVDPAGATGPDGRASIAWTLASSGENTLHIAIPGTSVETTVLVASAGERPAFSSAGVVNAAGMAQTGGGLAPGSLVTIFGANLAVATESAGRLPAPRELAGTQVFVNGAPAPLLYASPTQINLLLPYGLAGDFAKIAVSSGSGQSAAVNVPLAAVDPGIFSDPDSGTGAIRYNADGLAAVERPAQPGEYMEIYASGLGSVTYPPEAGEAALSFILSETTQDVAVLLDGVRLEPQFAGLAPTFSGLYQVNVELPQDLTAGRHELQLEVDGAASNVVPFTSE